MALVNGPLFSLDAAGQVGKAIVYSKWKGRNYVREYVTPANPRTLPQQFQRGIMTALVAWWQYIKTQAGLETSWTTLASAGNYSTFNAYTKANLDRESLDALPMSNDGTDGVAPGGTINEVIPDGGFNTLQIEVEIDTAAIASDLLMVSLGTVGGGPTTANTIQRTVASRANTTGTTTFIVTLENVPAGDYHAGARFVGSDGTATAWTNSGSPGTVTGLA